MLAKVIGILTILSHVFLIMPQAEIKAQKNQDKPVQINSNKARQMTKPTLADQTNWQNSFFSVSLKYTHDRNLTTFANITIKNKTKQQLQIPFVLLEGDTSKGCTRNYQINRKIELKPNQLITISQRLVPGDCEFHIVKITHIRYTMSINFTLD